jgi:hypothetical protein
MKLRAAIRCLTAISAAAVLIGIGGCAQMGGGGSSKQSDSGASAQPKGPGPGMNAEGEVVDSAKVEGGHGEKVKGLGDWEGEITGKPAPDSKFTKLQIGMSMKQVTDLAGHPTDQGGYVTGKAWIPWYFGSDRHRFEMAFKGQGRLVFAGGSLGDYSGGNLIWIIHNKNDSGYR